MLRMPTVRPGPPFNQCQRSTPGGRQQSRPCPPREHCETVTADALLLMMRSAPRSRTDAMRQTPVFRARPRHVVVAQMDAPLLRVSWQRTAPPTELPWSVACGSPRTPVDLRRDRGSPAAGADSMLYASPRVPLLACSMIKFTRSTKASETCWSLARHSSPRGSTTLFL